jgi:hypothetical protein
MHVKTTLALALTALAAGGGSAALAEAVQVSDDRRGDASCTDAPCPDLKSAVADRGIFDARELLYIVTQHNAVQSSRVPRIAINTRGRNRSRPEYYVEQRGSLTGVFDARTHAKAGPAELRSSSSTALTWTFERGAIGSPRSFGWRVEIVAGGRRIDATPDSGYRRRSLG